MTTIARSCLLPLIALTALAAGCSTEPASTADAGAADSVTVAEAAHGVAWFEGDIDAAFALSRQQDKPLFLYWGAEWCPYSAHLESSVFSRPEFIAQADRFIAVRIDGDDGDGPRLGQRFKLRGYPNTVLFAADGSEISRLPSGMTTADGYLQALDAALSAERSTRQIVDAALADDATLDGDDWRALTNYAWFIDQQQVLGERDPAATLLALAERCPPAQVEASRALHLQALMTALSGADPTATAAILPKALPLLEQVLSDPQLSREQIALLGYAVSGSLAALGTDQSAERERLQAQALQTMQQLAQDPAVPTRERLLIQIEAIKLTRHSAGAAPLPEAIINATQQLAAEADRITTDATERRAVIGAAAGALAAVGLGAEAEALLQAELPRSQAAYHLMAALAHYAGQREDAAAVLQWQRNAYRSGIASGRLHVRLRSAANLLRYLTTKAPEQIVEITEAADRLLDIAAADAAAFHPVNQRLWQGTLQGLTAWAEQAQQQAAIEAMRARMTELCAAIADGDPAQSTCHATLALPEPKVAQQ
jgi:hypothetical protein